MHSFIQTDCLLSWLHVHQIYLIRFRKLLLHKSNYIKVHIINNYKKSSMRTYIASLLTKLDSHCFYIPKIHETQSPLSLFLQTSANQSHVCTLLSTTWTLMKCTVCFTFFSTAHSFINYTVLHCFYIPYLLWIALLYNQEDFESSTLCTLILQPRDLWISSPSLHSFNNPLIHESYSLRRIRQSALCFLNSLEIHESQTLQSLIYR